MKKLIFNIMLLTISTWAISQNNINEAFSKSYTYEANQEYSKAVTEIMNVYDATSYTMNLRLGWLNYLTGEHLKSQGYYKKAIALEPNSIEARLGYVYPTSTIENWDDVIATYNDILSIDPQNSTVNYRLAYIYNYRRDFEKAANYAQKVVKLYPFDYNANYLLGQVYISQGKIKEAKVNLTRALQYNPSSTEIKSLLEKL